jgi:hypothetical protein
VQPLTELAPVRQIGRSDLLSAEHVELTHAGGAAISNGQERIRLVTR